MITRIKSNDEAMFNFQKKFSKKEYHFPKSLFKKNPIFLVFAIVIVIVRFHQEAKDREQDYLSRSPRIGDEVRLDVLVLLRRGFLQFRPTGRGTPSGRKTWECPVENYSVECILASDDCAPAARVGRSLSRSARAPCTC